ncbi:MAG: SRPBCC domain-containing protein [Chitinophagaceae bacterium]|nr:SRPBCC domain-containing protein [Chitinophagaceae bacterium]
MSSQPINWSSFSLRVNIRKDIQIIYDCWTLQAGLENWFLREAVFKDASGKQRAGNEPVQKGDTYEWRWHGYPDEVMERGTVLEANGKDQFIFTFSLQCPVTIRIYTEADETIVELTESGLPTDDKTRSAHFVGDSRGWVFYLTNLKSVLEGGVDLRNKKMELRNVITA